MVQGQVTCGLTPFVKQCHLVRFKNVVVPSLWNPPTPTPHKSGDTEYVALREVCKILAFPIGIRSGGLVEPSTGQCC